MTLRFKGFCFLVCTLSILIIGVGADEEADRPEDVPDLKGDYDGKEAMTDYLLDCLCSCVKPENSDFYCRYSDVPYPAVQGGSDFCENLSNGPCMCEALGCFRAPLPTSGDCYDACRARYPGVPVVEPPIDEEKETTSSPGYLVPGASLAFKPETEPNNQIGDSNEIEFASPAGVKGLIAPAGDMDFFKFYTESAGMLEVQIRQVPDQMRTRIDIYGKNMNWRTRKDASNPGDEITILVDIPGPGLGYMAISDLDGKAHSTEYSLVADFVPAIDDGEPNDQVGDSKEIVFDQAISSCICPVDDVDFYKFYVDSAGIMTINFDQVPDDMKTRVDLYSKNFNWITRKDASNAGDLLIMEVDLSGPAAYYLAVSDLDRRARSNQYIFQPGFLPAPDSYEPNDQVGDASDVGLGQTLTGYICPKNDADIYKIWVDAAAVLEVSLDKVPNDMRSRIDLYGKNFNWITRKDASNPGDAITLEKGLEGPGYYYIGISDLDAKAHDQEYQMIALLR
jgi:hypothetical protein